MKDAKELISNHVVALLQDIRARDPEAFAKLITWSTLINIEQGKHSTLQLTPGRGKAQGKYQLTLVGFLNSVLLAAGQPKIAAVVDNGDIVGFTLLEPSLLDLTTGAHDTSHQASVKSAGA